MINRISDNFNKYIKNTNIMDLLHMWTIEYYDYLSKQKNFYNDIPKIIRLDKRYNYRNDTYMKSKSLYSGNYNSFYGVCYRYIFKKKGIKNFQNMDVFGDKE